ncbi:MAG: hypothetical protein BJ554DRAFT_4469 [Olpidium bornovanus]|uniref:Uncharacterized protein n=1 Tax=Olpidium bornovanus TaxID=278681 RepID=A0A8H8A000_9FUNG|nr:MAG: hypothetical protein BJ554DRAFT_4469 [Olpidium bornovanus]
MESLGAFLELQRLVSELKLIDQMDSRDERFAQVQTLYKTVNKKVRSVAVELPPDAWDRIQLARKEPRLRPAEVIGHTFMEATLNSIRINQGKFGMLTKREEVEFCLMIGHHGRAFAFDKSEIGCVDPTVVPPVIIFTVPHVLWNLKPIPVLRVHFAQLLELLRDRLHKQVIKRGNGPYANRLFTVPKKNGKLRFIQDLQPANKMTICNAGVGRFLEEYVCNTQKARSVEANDFLLRVRDRCTSAFEAVGSTRE